MKIDVSDKVALVTGGAKGIGFDIAQELVTAGANVIITDIDEVAGNNAIQKLKQYVGSARFVYADVSSDTDTSNLINTIIDQDNGIDILINNAGIISKGNIIDVAVSEWEKLFDINVKSIFMLTKKALPYMMKKRWGRIVNIASVAGQTGGGFLGNTCYGATKGAIISFTKGIAREAGGYNITSNVICPGFIDTEITRNMDKTLYDKSLETIPLHRPAAPNEVAKSVLFLVSELADYVNGVTLNVDGGLVRY